MVNVEMLLKKLDGLVWETDYNIKSNDRNMVLWEKRELADVRSLSQLMGRINDGLDLSLYDKIYTRLDDAIFQPNLKTVESNLEKLGLKGTFYSCYYFMSCSGRISKRCFNYIENMEPIPKSEIVWSGERLYNDVLKASKEWKNEI